VDLIGDFTTDRTLSAFDKAGLEVRLSEVLDTPVELCDRRFLHDEIRLRAEREAVLVF
jgi:predicted nucleotidyltransferase